MRKPSNHYLRLSAAWLTAFALFTLLVSRVDIRPIGPEGSSVGFATINGFVFRLLGTRPIWYTVTEWIAATAIVLALVIATEGAWQRMRRKSICKVDRLLLITGGFWAAMAACYLFFECVVINCRPVLTEGSLEASYPSSHTLFVACIAAAAAERVRTHRPQNRNIQRLADLAALFFTTVTAVGRLLAGVHWATDIVASLLLASGLIALYRAALVQKHG